MTNQTSQWQDLLTGTNAANSGRIFVATVLSVKGFDRYYILIPISIISDHRIDDNKELLGTGGNGKFFRFASQD